MEGIHFQTSGNHDGKHLFHDFCNSERTAAWYFCCIKEKQVAGFIFISTLVMVFISVPSYVYALLIQYLLCYKLKLFPLQMNSGTNYFSLSMFRSVMPAVLALAFGSIASLADMCVPSFLRY